MDAQDAKNTLLDESLSGPIEWLELSTYSRKGGKSKPAVKDCFAQIASYVAQGQVVMGCVDLEPLLMSVIEPAQDRLGRKLSQSALVLLAGQIVYPSANIDTEHFSIQLWQEKTLNFLKHEYGAHLRLVLLVDETVYFYVFPNRDENDSFSLGDAHRGLRVQETVDRNLKDYRKRQRFLFRQAIAELNDEYFKDVLAAYSLVGSSEEKQSYNLVYTRQSLPEQVKQLHVRLEKLNANQVQLSQSLSTIAADVKRYQSILLAYEHLISQKQKIEAEVQVVSNRVRGVTKEGRSLWSNVSYFLAVLAGNAHTIKEERSQLAELFRELNAVEETIQKTYQQLQDYLNDKHVAIVWASTQKDLQRDKEVQLDDVYNRFRYLQYYQAKLKRDERQCQQRTNQLQRALQVLNRQINQPVMDEAVKSLGEAG